MAIQNFATLPYAYCSLTSIMAVWFASWLSRSIEPAAAGSVLT